MPKARSFFKAQEKSIEAKIDSAEETLESMSAADFEYLRDMPSMLLVMRNQLAQVSQITTIAKSIKPVEDESKVLDELAKPDQLDQTITHASSLLPFSNDEFAYMSQAVLDINQMEEDHPAGDGRNKLINAKFEEINTKIGGSRMTTALASAPAFYDSLYDALTQSYTQFETASNFLKAIELIRNLVPKTHPPLAELQDAISPLIGDPKNTDDSMALAIVAVFSGFQGDTYEKPNDVKDIRDQTTFIPKQDMINWLQQVKTANQGAQ